MNTTPTMQAILDALRDGAATTDELKTRTGTRRRATLDKALTELNNARAISPLPAESGEQPRWSLTGDQPSDQSSDTSGEAPERAVDTPHGVDSPRGEHGSQAVEAASGEEPNQGPIQGPRQALTDPQPITDTEATADAEATTGGETTDDRDGEDARDGEEEVKTCAGCQARMPVICPGCGRKTTTYCGSCRRNMPTRRRGVPEEPQILVNGLPKLRPGQLEALVLDVLRRNPLPTHRGIVGWTAGRVAVHLPGRSTGAIIGVLNKLAGTGTLELLSETPARYQLAQTASLPPGEAPHQNADDGATGDGAAAGDAPATSDTDVHTAADTDADTDADVEAGPVDQS